MSAPSPGRRDCESLNDYIRRLEAAADTHMLRVSDAESDGRGGIVIHPVVIYAVDDTGTPHELMDASGRMKHYEWPAGDNQLVTGTFTKTVGAGVGYLDITPGADDELILMYGQLIAGGVAVGWTSVEIFHTGALAGAGARQDRYVLDGGPAAAETWSIPALGTAGTGPINISTHNTDLSNLIADGTWLKTRVAGMAVDEVFTIHYQFRSLLNVAPIATPDGGTWA